MNSWCTSEHPANPARRRSACVPLTAPPLKQHLSANCRGGLSPQVSGAAAPAAARDTRLHSLAALQAGLCRQGLAAPHSPAPLGALETSHATALPSISRVVFFRPSPLSSGLLLNFIRYYSKKNKNRSSLLNVYLRSKIVIKINQLGALKQISLILYQAGKKLAKKTPLI